MAWYDARVMRYVLLLLAGATFGILMTVLAIQISGGWYVYQTIPSTRYGECYDPIPGGAEIVPHQPNPCHYRRPRWRLGS